MGDFRFVHEERVRWSDLDAMGVLNNAVYLTLFEQARFHYFQALGLMTGARFPFVLAATSVDFLRPVGAGAALVIGARVTRLSRKSFAMRYEVRDGAETVAEAEATLVCVDGALRSVAIDDDFREAVAGFEGIPPGPA
jgi:acyl-CoA thioester hydrolase